MKDTQETVKAADTMAADDQELVTCVLDNVEFGLDINAVQEIVRLPKITPVPKAPSYVEGVANLRGNVLPIINSRSRFGMRPSENAENGRVVVVELNGNPTGLIVDSVREVMHVQPKNVEVAPPVVHSVSGRFLKGIVKLDEGRRLVLLLDHDAVLDGDGVDVPALVAGAAAAAADPTGAEAATGGEQDSEQLVTFRLAEEEYGLPIMDVQEIIRVPEISTVPNAPAGVIGIASLRNRILPVMDLRTTFGFATLADTTERMGQRLAAFRSRQQQRVATAEQAVMGEGKLSADDSDELDRWLDTLPAGDKVLAALASPVYEALKGWKEACRRLRSLVDSGDLLAANEEFVRTLKPAHDHLLTLVDKMREGLTRREDERCLVVRIGEKSVALRVDAVNQVIEAPKSLVEATPAMVSGAGGREQIRGIAKLEDGKRLIMLLAVDKLLERSNLDGIGQEALEGNSAESHAGQTDEDERQLVSFCVANEEFAVDIMQVQEIVRLAKVTKVPHSPPFVEGVVNLRGNVLPVIDLRKRVHMPVKEYNDATRVVVVDLAGKKTGIIVDAVSEVMAVRKSSIEAAPEIARSTYGDQFIEGVGKLDKGERMFLLLRADELLREEGATSSLNEAHCEALSA